VPVLLSGQRETALVDTGCSRSIISRLRVEGIDVECVRKPVVMMDGTRTVCNGACTIDFLVDGRSVTLSCLVEDILPGYDMLLGVDAVRLLGGVFIDARGGVNFGNETPCAAIASVPPESAR